METLESSRVCRLCGKHSGISINIFDRNESHVKKINAVLPIMVHEMDLLPKHMCHRCSYKLEEFHKFYVDCLKTDANLKSQLSWMSKTESRKSTGTPMVHIENLHVKTEPRDYYDLYEDDSTIEMDSLTYPVNGVRKNIPEDIKYATYTRCDYCCDNDDQSNQTVSTNYEKKVKKCDRISERNNAGCDGNVEKFQDVKKRPNVDACSSKTRSRLKRKIEGQGNEGRVNFLGTSESSSNSMLHNLRPRTGSINYKDTRKRVVPDAEISAKITKKISAPRPAFGESLQRFSETQIKVEKEDELEGRILRLRKRINYLEKSSKVVKNDQRTRSSKKLVSDSKSSASQTPSADATTLRIKQEVLSDLEDKATEELQRTKRVLRSQAVPNFDAKVNTVSNKILLELKKNVINNRKPGRPRKHRIDCGLADNSSSLENVEKNLMKLNSASLKRIAEIRYSSKYSNRNGDFKNNRARKLNVEKKGGLKDNLKNYGEKNLLEVIQGMVNSESPAERMNLIENKIKHYCDECDTQFASKELYKLHPCYV